MLAPNARAVLLDQLRPPVGYRLDAAVATTFTLDLASALVPPLAFAAFEMRATPDPVAALEAVRSCADRVDVFCQAGQIHVPSQASDLMAFLEPMVHEVKAPRPGHLFHPKIWFLRYTADDEQSAAHRLLVLTRNLTGDRSWDIALRLDGQISGGPKAYNKPLADLLRALPGLAITPLPTANLARIAGLAEDARRIEWELPDDIKEMQFHVFGIPSLSADPDFSGYRHLAVTPFCDDVGLATVAPDATDLTVVSRSTHLDQLPADSLECANCWVLSSLAGLDDPDQEPASVDSPSILSGLHAKMYVVERNRIAHVFIGSANATRAAFGGNVEILVELTGGPAKIGVDKILDDTAGLGSLLEPYNTAGGEDPDPDDEALHALENLLRSIASHRYTVTVTDASHHLQLATSGPLPDWDEVRVTAELLTRPGRAVDLTSGASVSAGFDQVPLADITPFVVLRAETTDGLKRGAVIRTELVNDPSGRLDEIVARQVDTPEKFLQFLMLLLGLADPAQFLNKGKGEGEGIRVEPTTGIFELVLRALADNPSALEQLARLVTRLQATDAGRSVLPDGFTDLWVTVSAAQAHLTGAGR